MDISSNPLGVRPIGKRFEEISRWNGFVTTLGPFNFNFPENHDLWWSRQGDDEYSESDVFRRSGATSRCAGMSGTWSGVLYIDFEVKNGLIIIIQCVVLKLVVAGQEQLDMVDMNESYRWLPHSVSHRKNVQFRVINDQNRIREVKIMFANRLPALYTG